MSDQPAAGLPRGVVVGSVTAYERTLQLAGVGQKTRSAGTETNDSKKRREVLFKMFEDRVLVCKDCGKEFVFSAGEQEFYAQNDFKNDPARCPACRKARKQQRSERLNGPREMFDAVCAACGKPTKVPFEPKNDKPVYCSECFAQRRGR